MKKKNWILSVAFGFILAVSLSSSVQASEKITVCLITKTYINPFFVKMKEGASAKAKELGMELKSYAGRIDGDSESQVIAIESCIADSAKGILITASDTKGIVPTIQKARKAGLLVIALDTPLEPITAADATFATDNFKAGKLIGQWAKGTLGAEAAKAKIAMLDLSITQPSVGVLRDQGFLSGFGIDLKNPNKWGDETDSRIVGNEVTAGNEEGGRKAMESLLSQDPQINVVYTINEPAAAGAYQALRAFNRQDDVLVVSVDGGCPGVRDVKSGVIGATSQQYPLLMASMGVEAVHAWVTKGTKPKNTPGLDFFDTGVNLVTDRPVPGVPSIDTKEGTNRCWG